MIDLSRFTIRIRGAGRLSVRRHNCGLLAVFSQASRRHTERVTIAAAVTLAGVMLLGAMSPGPDFVLVVRNALTSGRAVGTACAMGVGCGVAVWAVAAAVGIAGLLATSATLFTAVKLCGAAYLVYLGVTALRRASVRSGAGPDVQEAAAGEVTWGTAFLQGLVTNVFNPKSALFFVALLPQFIPHEATIATTMTVCAITAGVTAGWFGVLALAVGTLRHGLARPRVRRAIDAVTGTILIALGLRIAIARG